MEAFLNEDRIAKMSEVADEVRQGELEARSESKQISIQGILREIRDEIETAQIRVETALDLSEDTVWKEDILRAADAIEELHSMIDNLHDKVRRW